jgi:hypothetical protein
MPVVLPLVPSIPNYRVGVTLDGEQYLFDVRWNTRAGGWFFDLLLEDETHIASGIRVVLGVLLGRRMTHDRRPRGGLFAVDSTGQHLEAGFDDLGSRVEIFYYTKEELDELAGIT